MVLNSLLRSRKFWIAVFALLMKVVAYYIPNFPPEIWAAIEELAIVLIAAIAVEDAARHIGANRA